MSIKLATLVAMAASPSESGIPAPEEEEYYSSWSLFLVCMLLILSLWTSYYLQIKRIRAVHETLVSIFAGMFVGLVVRLAPGTMIRDMLTFRHTLFFNLLLPPIILNSGYELKQENFFRNFGSILIFAFFGTFISAVGVGVLVWIYSSLGIESLELTLLECLTFGSTLSATDPVTILAIFQQYKVDPKLYSVIFGESLLNDAVSIVMYQTLTQFHGTEVYLSSIFSGLGIFILSFTVSLALGVSFGLGMSLILKHSSLHLFPSIESCLIPLCAYTCYFFSTGLEMSGIVSLLFCGITLKHYAYHTMSQKTQRATKYLFSTLARLSENFIFIYLGISLFTSAPTTVPVMSYVKPLFIAITTVAVVFTRYAAVFPLSEAINLFQKHARGQRTEELPHSYQMMLFWAGLRGAVGVALAAGFTGPNAQVLRTTVLVVVVLTVLLFGGTTARMLEVLGIRTGVEDDADSSDDEDFAGRAPWTGRRSGRFGSFVDDEPSALSQNQSYPSRAAQVGSHYGARSYNHQAQGPAVFSTSSSSSFDSDSGEILPMAITPDLSTGHPPRQSLAAAAAGVGQDGKWFQALDERYLLPIFSNATASRTFHARRARRTASGAGGLGAVGGGSGTGTPGHSSEDEDDISSPEIELGRTPRVAVPPDLSRTERGLPSPTLRSNSFNGEGRIS
ncbi:sodium/hydrogen exchanger [Lyophyllum atratum]|nr:sodium/hydrogen exchanger [Lyophyllum atratum]